MKLRKFSKILLCLGLLSLAGCPIPDARKEEVGSSSSGGEASSSSSSASSTSSSSSGNGGAGGNGGTAGMGGVGGIGGAVASSSSSSGGPVCPKQPGEEGSCGTVECPAVCPKLVMVGTGMTNGLGATFMSGDMGGWTTQSIAGMKSDFPPAFAIRTGKGDGVAVFRNTTSGSLYNLAASAWTQNGFGMVKDVAPSIAQVDFSPVAVATADTVHVGFRTIGNSHEYRYAAFDGGNFNPANEDIRLNTSKSLGFCAPAFAIADNKVLLINPGEKSNGNDDEGLYGRYRELDPLATNPWDGGFNFMAIRGSLLVDDVTPAIVPLSAGPELLVVFTEKVAAKPLYFMTRTANTWSAPVKIPNTSSIEVVLLPLTSGEAVLVYRAYDFNTSLPTKVFWSRFNGSSWSTVTEIPGGKLAKSKPVLALGAGDAEAELLFIDSMGDVQHARLRKGAMNFDPPMPINGASGLVGIAAATNL